jgi:hypothetical protein
MTIIVTRNEIAVTPGVTTVALTVAPIADPIVLTAGVQGLQGPPGNINWRGAYGAGTPYVHDDGVTYNGSSFVCLVACTGVTPEAGINWSMIAAAGGELTGVDGGTWTA